MFKIVYLYEFCLGWVHWVRNMFLRELEMEVKKKKIPEVVGVMLEVFCFSDRRLFFIFNCNSGYFYLKFLKLTKDQLHHLF